MPGLHIPIAINIEEGNLAGAPVEITQRQEEKGQEGLFESNRF